jgi:adenosine deaminase
VLATTRRRLPLPSAESREYVLGVDFAAWAGRIRAWPKADLHCHLDGSLRASTLAELALGGRTEAEARRAIRAGAACESLVEYLEAFRITVSALQTEARLRRVAREIVEDAAAENVRLLELRFCPFLHTRSGLSDEGAVDAVLAGLDEGRKATGIHAGLILCAMRERPPEEALRLSELAGSRRASGVVAVDLAGPEAGYPADGYAEAFARAREAGLGVTVHAGEADGPASVWSALRALGARRIGHACRAVEDPRLVEAMARAGVVVEACPRSNLQTRAVSRLEAHPLRELQAAGVKVAVATDNRLITDTTVTLELARVASALDLRADAVGALIVAGFEGAFAPEAVRTSLAEEARAAIAAASD